MRKLQRINSYNIHKDFICDYIYNNSLFCFIRVFSLPMLKYFRIWCAAVLGVRVMNVHSSLIWDYELKWHEAKAHAICNVLISYYQPRVKCW